MRFAEQSASTARRAKAMTATPKETLMQWSHPAFEDLRFGFEITMYISNR
jgi:coenzyme PQQ precursor peptide PqqA